jgi:glycosyltransferase involved in cell wall biosynthesis
VRNLSIIIPLYNKERRLKGSLKSLNKFLLKKNKNKIETIFISDGNSDNTNRLINLFIIKNKKNIYIEELPLEWINIKDSKLNLIKDMPIILYDIFKIKLRNN